MSPDGSRPVARPAPQEQRSPLSLALLALAAALAVLHLALPLASLPRLVPRNYNEGWNAYHAEAVTSERPLYPEPAALFPNNYPPLSFGLVALASRVLPDPIRAGRVLSLLAFAAVLVQIGWIARRVTGDRRLGVFAALLFAAWMGAAFDDYVATNDPQLLAHALMLGGLVLVTGGRGLARTAGAAACMLLGGLVKHNLLALPLAVTFWLYRRDRAAFLRWLAASALLALASLGTLWWIHGASLFASVLGPRTSSLELAARASAEYLRSLAAPLAVGLFAVREASRDPDASLLALYAGAGLALGFAFTAGEGVSHNAYFDLLIALALLGPFLISRYALLVPSAAGAFPAGALALALLVGPLLEAPAALVELPRRLAALERLERVTQEDVAYLASRRGPALCESLAHCFWAEQPASVDLFNSQQLFRAGRADEDALLERVAAGEFAVVFLHVLTPDRDDERVSGQLSRALQLHYVVDRISANGVFLTPRRGRASPDRRAP